jgi:ArsR family transcriptional regulator, lead/cadmium/zinc/bismuth-responsive transcriptional repressor
MATPSRQRALRPARVRAARKRLLTGPAAQLVEQVRAVFCEPTRAQIVRALGAGPLTGTDLAVVVGRSRSVVSQHLRILREVGLVRSTRQGRLVHYSLATGPVARSSVLALEAVEGVAS